MSAGGPNREPVTSLDIWFRGKRIGRIDGDTYTSHRRPEHFVRRFNGWGVQLQIWNDLKASGIQNIVMDLGTTRLFSRMTDWERFGHVATLNPDDGEQIFLERGYFMEVRK